MRALVALPALHGHEPAAEGARAVVHGDPPDDPAHAGLDLGRGGGHPVLSLAAHGAIPVHPKLVRLGVHHGAIREQATPGRAAGGRDPQVAPAPCASPVEPDHGHPAALQIPLRAFGMRSHGEQGSHTIGSSLISAIPFAVSGFAAHAVPKSQWQQFQTISKMIFPM
jgi:hypothetical protein